MAKLFNVFLENEYGDNDYLGSYKAMTMSEAVRAALNENDLDPRLYDKKTNTYDGRAIVGEE